MVFFCFCFVDNINSSSHPLLVCVMYAYMCVCSLSLVLGVVKDWALVMVKAWNGCGHISEDFLECPKKCDLHIALMCLALR